MNVRYSVVLAALSLLLAGSNCLIAQTDSVWTGTSGDWSDLANWSNGVPSGDFDAVIPVTARDIVQDLSGLQVNSLEITGPAVNLVLDEQITVSDTFIWTKGEISGAGSLSVNGAGTIQDGILNTTLNNFGTVEFLQRGIASSTEQGIWNNHSGSLAIVGVGVIVGSLEHQVGTFNNLEGATLLQPEGSATYMVMDVYNEGLIEIENNSQMLFVKEFVQAESGTLHLKGDNSIADTFGPAQIEGRVIGNGAMISSIELGGVVSPGQPSLNPIGFIDVAGDMIMMPNSVLEIDLGTEVDLIGVSHRLTLAGTVNLNLHQGLVPGTYTLAYAGQQLIPGDIKLGALPEGLSATLFVNVGNKSLDLVVTSVVDNVVPDSLNVIKGIVRSGNAIDLAESDNVDVMISRDTNQVQSSVELAINGVTTNLEPSSLAFTVEGSVFARSNITQTIELYDFDSESFEPVDTRIASRFTDAVTTVEATGNLSRFVQAGTGAVEARILFSSPIARQRFSSNLDQVRWAIE